MSGASRDPLRFCGQVTDPVSGERFRPTVASPRAVHLGRSRGA